MTATDSDTIRVLADDRRRDVLAAVDRLGPPTSVETIAEELGDRWADVPGREPPPDRTIARLHHCDLPALADVGLVDYDPEAAEVLAANDPPEWARRSVTGSREQFDEALSAVADPRRRTALSVLVEAGRPLSVERLAARVAARSDRTDERRVRVSLVHGDLPALDEADLVAYDAEDSTVTATPSTWPTGGVPGVDARSQRADREEDGDLLELRDHVSGALQVLQERSPGS